MTITMKGSQFKRFEWMSTFFWAFAAGRQANGRAHLSQPVWASRRLSGRQMPLVPILGFS